MEHGDSCSGYCPHRRQSVAGRPSSLVLVLPCASHRTRRLLRCTSDAPHRRDLSVRWSGEAGSGRLGCVGSRGGGCPPGKPIPRITALCPRSRILARETPVSSLLSGLGSERDGHFSGKYAASEWHSATVRSLGSNGDIGVRVIRRTDVWCRRPVFVSAGVRASDCCVEIVARRDVERGSSGTSRRGCIDTLLGGMRCRKLTERGTSAPTLPPGGHVRSD